MQNNQEAFFLKQSIFNKLTFFYTQNLTAKRQLLKRNIFPQINKYRLPTNSEKRGSFVASFHHLYIGLSTQLDLIFKLIYTADNFLTSIFMEEKNFIKSLHKITIFNFRSWVAINGTVDFHCVRERIKIPV